MQHDPSRKLYSQILQEHCELMLKESSIIAAFAAALECRCPNDAKVKEIVLDLRQIRLQISGVITKAMATSVRMLTGELPDAPVASMPCDNPMAGLVAGLRELRMPDPNDGGSVDETC